MKRIIYKTHREDARGNVFTVLYNYRVFFDGKDFLIPAGFESDGASVPRLFWRVIFPNTDSNAASAGICHDYIYREQLPDWTRKEADRMFLAFMISHGVGVMKAYLAYFAVRAFGWIAWRQNSVFKAKEIAAGVSHAMDIIQECEEPETGNKK